MDTLNKKKIFIYSNQLDIGGIEKSLIGLLNAIDYNKFEVDLLLEDFNGPLSKFIPNEVNKIIIKELQYCTWAITKLIKNGKFSIALRKIFIKLRKKDLYYDIRKQLIKRCEKLNKKYDLALSFCVPFYFVIDKVDAKVKIGWLHTDYSAIDYIKDETKLMCDNMDLVASISQSSLAANCKEIGFDKSKGLVIENILSPKFVKEQSQLFDVKNEMPDDCDIKILSVGRFCAAKNFDNVPHIAKKLIELGLNFKWYLIGYGSEEQLINTKIKEAGMENTVLLLGKKENPYPYMAECDLYIQPSRYEGKAVTVREAQMLCKPVIITNYNTSMDQLKDGVDGIIVPLKNEDCASAIFKIANDKKLLDKLIENCNNSDFGNECEVEKIYNLVGEI